MTPPISTIRATAMLGMALLTQALFAAPPPVLTGSEIAAVKADAASRAAAAAESGAAAHASLQTDLTDAAEASKALSTFLVQADAPAQPESAVPPPAKPLEITNSPNDTVVNCTGGAYFDADAGVLVYLKNVTVKDPRYDMRGADELKIFFEKKPVEAKKESTTGAAEGSDDKPNAEKPSSVKKEPGIGGDMGSKFGDVERIVATGAVLIEQRPVPGKDPIKASGAIFTYNLKTDQMILSGGYPWFTQGATYMRAKEPNLILRLFPNTGSFRTEGNWESGGNLQQKDPQKDPKKVTTKDEPKKQKKP